MVVTAPVAPELIPTDPESLGDALRSLEGVGELRERLDGHEAWLVGGAVRDLLLGRLRADLDILVEGDASAIASLIGAEPSSHERFGTATALLGGHRVDIASARRESYGRPGALPEVEPATLADDLARRDFTINAMALPLVGPAVLVDPFGGRADLEAGLVRILHPRSFVDDPTRALRAARYAARLELSIEARTAKLLGAVDLGTVSADRIDAELRRLVAEKRAPKALRLLNRWGLAGIDEGAAERLSAARGLMFDVGWAQVLAPELLQIEAARPSEGTRRAVARLAGTQPESPSAGMSLAQGAHPVDLAMARISGAEWLDDWAREWRKVELEIDGGDLLDAGVEQGPAVGRGLAAALAAKLDGEIAGRDQELRVALGAAAAT